MAISNINLAMGASSYGAYQQKLTQATKSELDKFGIAYNPNITEQEGKALLLKYKSQNAHNENSSGAKFNNNQKNSFDTLFERAKNLAKKLGISFDENISFRELLGLIEQNIESKIQVNKNNQDLLKQLKVFSEELAQIQAQSIGSSGFSANNQALEMSLEMLSLYNKNFMN